MSSPREEAALAREDLTRGKKKAKKCQTLLQTLPWAGTRVANPWAGTRMAKSLHLHELWNANNAAQTFTTLARISFGT